MLDHGTGGGVGARDLVVATEVATGRRLTVALVAQPYRVTGRRSTPAAHLLDQAWIHRFTGRSASRTHRDTRRAEAALSTAAARGVP